jgi:hypothetical protein
VIVYWDANTGINGAQDGSGAWDIADRRTGISPPAGTKHGMTTTTQFLGRVLTARMMSKLLSLLSVHSWEA